MTNNNIHNMSNIIKLYTPSPNVNKHLYMIGYNVISSITGYGETYKIIDSIENIGSTDPLILYIVDSIQPECFDLHKYNYIRNINSNIVVMFITYKN